jgi:hypothetical protein
MLINGYATTPATIPASDFPGVLFQLFGKAGEFDTAFSFFAVFHY